MSMFADPFCDTPWAQTSRRGWTTLISFGAQMLGVGMLLLVPLIYNDGLPGLRALATPVSAPMPLGQPQLAQRQAGTQSAHSTARSQSVQIPKSIPREIFRGVDVVVPPTLSGTEVSGLPTGRRGIPNGVSDSIFTSADAAIPPPAPKPVAHPPRISRMMEGNLIHRVQPVYPTAAKLAHIQGSVVLRAVISKDGAIENLAVVSGQPMLVKAAMDAVSQWRYRPYMLNGDPFEVETQVTVNFVLN
jgi:periplasmic protein TonB